MWQMLRLSVVDDVWCVLGPPNDIMVGTSPQPCYYWKAAILRECLLLLWGDGEVVASSLDMSETSHVLEQLKGQQRQFLEWFFEGWLSPSHLSTILAASLP
jgi:hypothetical protein